ncbi:thioredoxin [Peptostreptococcus canis]|uniref:Thioredoxin n=1 Tax=Peptostreptococcus canis TaxID=1159213 RepID=A0ABR6TK15_9FIRM|nr:thioredoxin [Peptostreptococcus canis]MBC2575749.1 thioredoxin [Peptostreptococcus canis]MBP1998136.1 thioredoxin 1 [Peptostreptococcus canis]
MAKVISSQEFVKNVKEEKGIAVIDFFATWCGPCNMLGPVFSDVAEELKNEAFFAKVDVDQSMDIAQEFGVSTVPTVIFFKDGVEVKREIGFMPKEKITSALNSIK